MNQEYTRAPHRRPSSETPSHSAALLIDFDNVTMGIRSNLGQELRSLLDSDIIRGKVAVQRAYADWRRYPQYIVPLSESSIDLIFAPAYGSSKKNATDIRLAIDALELVFTRPEIGTFMLLSGDSDFSSLVLKLKEYGKYVIGVGLQESTSDILVQNCDEYYSYNRLSGLTSAEEMDIKKHDPWELVEKAVIRMSERGDVMRSDRLKQVMLEIDAAFDEKTAGFSKFNRFLAEAAHRDLVRMRKGQNGQYEVAPGGATEMAIPATEPAPTPSGGDGRRSGRSRARRGRSGERSRREASEARSGGGEEEASETFEGEVPEVALQSAYDALAGVVEDMYEGEPIRDSMVKRKMLERDRSFDEGTLGFRKFSRFLRQAHDEGIVDLTQGDEGNYYLKPAAGADAHPSRATAAPGGRGREGAGRSRSRGRGGDAPVSRPAPEREAPEAEPEPEETAAASETEPAAEEGDDSAIAAAAKAARRTLGRFRRGSGSTASSPGGSDHRPKIGPVDVGGSDEPDAEEAEAEQAQAQAAPQTVPTQEAAPSRRRQGLGRYRSGSRSAAPPASGSRSSSSASRIGPVSKEELGASASEEGAGAQSRSARADVTATEASRETDGPEGGDGPIDHMVRHYRNVGKRTAEALVDEFGDRVFEVIDREPDRLSEVVSERRAKAVVEARRAELED